MKSPVVAAKRLNWGIEQSGNTSQAPRDLGSGQTRLLRARKVVRGLSLSLTQDERQAVATAAVDEASQARTGINRRWMRNCRRRLRSTRRRRVIEPDQVSP